MGDRPTDTYWLIHKVHRGSGLTGGEVRLLVNEVERLRADNRRLCDVLPRSVRVACGIYEGASIPEVVTETDSYTQDQIRNMGTDATATDPERSNEPDGIDRWSRLTNALEAAEAKVERLRARNEWLEKGTRQQWDDGAFDALEAAAKLAVEWHKPKLAAGIRALAKEESDADSDHLEGRS